jgi:hypothetical protein
MVIMNFNLVLLWKVEFFGKVTKRYKLCEILEFIRIGIWNVCVYVAALLSDMCIYSVEAFELGYFDFGGIIRKC